MYEKPLASEEHLMLPLIRRSEKSTKLNLPEYFHKPLLPEEKHEQRAFLFQNKPCQINILNQNQNKHLNAMKKGPSNSKLITDSSALETLQKCLRESSENSLPSLYEPCVCQGKRYILETVQNELKPCHIWEDCPAKSASNKAIDDILSNIPGKKHNIPQGNKAHIMNDKHISESADSIFLHICNSKDQKPEKKSSLLQLFPIGILVKSLSVSSVFQPLHKRPSVNNLNSNFDCISVNSKTTEVSAKRSDKALKTSMNDAKQNFGNIGEKLYNDTLTVTPRHNKINTHDIYVPHKLSNFDKNCKGVISKGISNEVSNNTALGTGYKECSQICNFPVHNISSAEVMEMYEDLFRELGIEPEGLAPRSNIRE